MSIPIKTDLIGLNVAWRGQPFVHVSGRGQTTTTLDSVWRAQPFVTPLAPTVVTSVPISDIAAGGWLPSSGGSLYLMLDEASPADFADYIYSPNNPTTQQFEVKLGSLTDPLVSIDHGVDIAMEARGLDTNFDFNLVQGTTILDSWTENVLLTDGQVTRRREFSGTVIDSITDYSDLRIRGVARA